MEEYRYASKEETKEAFQIADDWIKEIENGFYVGSRITTRYLLSEFILNQMGLTCFMTRAKKE